MQILPTVLFHPSWPILDRLRDVRRLDALAPRQIRDRPRQLEHPVIRPRAQVHLPHRRAQELPAGLVHRAVVAHLGRTHVGVGGQAGALAVLRRWRTAPIAAPAPPRRAPGSPPMARRGARR